MKYILTLFALSFLTFSSQAQELNVSININTPKLQTADPATFDIFKTSLVEFFTNTKWTEDYYEQEERIDVSIVITVTDEISIRDFKGNIAIQATRPIYGSDKATVIFNHQDNEFFFTYEQFQPIQFTPNTFNDNLTATLSFYAYVILGLDGDSFAPLGGEKHLQTAFEIMNQIPSSVTRNAKGWRAVDGQRNRYWLIENLLTPRVQPLRQAWYDYHRLGLDQLASDQAVARVFMLKALEAISGVDKNYPNSMIIQVFSNTKSEEILQVFNSADPTSKNKVADIMSKIDPANAMKYRLLRN
ncbi:MAG: DUF4835 family protein [Saprospiraceae bacterium]